MGYRDLFRKVLCFIPALTLPFLLACSVLTGKAEPAPQPTISVKSASSPTPGPRPTATPLGGRAAPAILVTAPTSGQLVKSPLRITGTASVFEAHVAFDVKDASGKVIGKGFTTASVGAPMRGDFSADLSFTQPITTQAGTVEVYWPSPKDGSLLDLVSIKVTLAGR